MSQYTPTTGIITRIDQQGAGQAQSGCSLLISLQSEDQGFINMTVSGSTYVAGCRALNVGDRVTFFYDTTAPTILIYPPQYQAVAAALRPSGTYATLDYFTTNPYTGRLTNSDSTLELNVSNRTRLILPNGQPFGGALSGKYLLVLYSATTRSIPAQTTPEQIVVFCGD